MSFKWFFRSARTRESYQLQGEVKRAQEAVEWSKRIDSVKHLLSHGNAAEALDRMGDLLLDMDLIRAHSAVAQKLAAGMTEFETYIRNNRKFIPNFGERLSISEIRWSGAFELRQANVPGSQCRRHWVEPVGGGGCQVSERT